MSLVSMQFLGGADTVTGSKTLFQYNGRRFLIDCGLFQGPKEVRSRNWHDFKEASEIEAVFLTHAHIDHSGYLPKLVKEGFRNPIYCSRPTADLCRIMLLDSAHLQEEDARYANRTGHSRHSPAQPLYTTKDAQAALELLTPIDDDEWFDLGGQLSVLMRRSGHILGSRFVQLSFHKEQDRRLLTFSGDLGNGRSYVLKRPCYIQETDYLVIESTYGNRTQSRAEPFDDLAKIINTTLSRKGIIIIPSFTVGRTQELLHILGRLDDEKQIPSVPVYIDSPMALNATQLYLKHAEELQLLVKGDRFVPPFQPRGFKPVSTVDESMALCRQEGPFIVISAAGMLTGGRILHHLKARLPDSRNSVVFVGYQAEGTKGRLLQDGMKEIRLHHEAVPVKAEIHSIESLSAHADADDILQWLGHFQKKPVMTWINHGEPEASLALQKRLLSELGWKSGIAHLGEKVTLNNFEKG